MNDVIVSGCECTGGANYISVYVAKFAYEVAGNAFEV